MVVGFHRKSSGRRSVSIKGYTPQALLVNQIRNLQENGSGQAQCFYSLPRKTEIAKCACGRNTESSDLVLESVRI